MIKQDRVIACNRVIGKPRSLQTPDLVPIGIIRAQPIMLLVYPVQVRSKELTV
jgi:hypothetical protein